MTVAATTAPSDSNTQAAAEPATTAIARPAPVSVDTSGMSEDGGALNAFSSAGNFVTAQRMATALAASTMVPVAYQGNVPNCLIAIELASRIGASVFAVMQNMDIIHGRPGWRSTFLIATVNTSRRFTPLRFRWVSQEGKPDWGCRAWAKDVDTGEECVGALIDWRMVKAEGWLDRKGSKWQTMPEQMFMYRAAGFWTRIYCPEASLGMHTAEEVSDMNAIDVVATPVPGSAIEEQGKRLSLGRPRQDTPPAATTTPPAKPTTPGTSQTKPPTATAAKADLGAAISPGPGKGAAPAASTPHDAVTGEVKTEPPADFVMPTSRQRKELSEAIFGARISDDLVCQWFGVDELTALSAGQVVDALERIRILEEQGKA